MLIDTNCTSLLNSLTLGVCLVEAETSVVLFSNELISTWFPTVGAGVALSDAVPGLTPDALAGLINGGLVQLSTKVKRRSQIIQIKARRMTLDGREILVLEGQNVSRLHENGALIDSYAAMVERHTRDLEREKVRVEKLLLNIMPRSVYEEYMSFGSVAPRLFEPVSVLILDFVGFTQMSVSADPNVTVAELNDIFTAFDRIGELYGCERIKTIGDCYLAVTGLPHAAPDHAIAAAKCAAKMIRYLERRNRSHEHQWRARIGIASGPVVGSVVGVQKYIYDVFGPAVNLAARLQSTSNAMEITVCQSLLEELHDSFDFNHTRTETLKGFGEVKVASISRRFRQQVNDKEPKQIAGSDPVEFERLV
ncbi:MAG: adenylate/guanylate cyclase domain-containing protein [Sulfitobacter sp.]